jgi:syntaxin 5
MSLQNRTQEYFSAVESCKTIGIRDQLLSSAQSPTTKSEFTKQASQVAREISATSTKLQKLTSLAKQKSLFEDKPAEINELIQQIKQDIQRLNSQIAALGRYLMQEDGQMKEHSKIIISSLQAKIVSYSNSFKTVLQTRQENMKQQKQRRDEYSFQPAGKGFQASDSPLYHPEKRTRDTVVDFGASMQTQSLVQPTANMEYIESRSEAIAQIETTIQELGQIYQNFNVILQGQREMVQRIDDNVQDVSVNVEGAHTQLVKFYQNMSGNQALMVKVFGVFLAFFMMFVMMT